MGTILSLSHRVCSQLLSWGIGCIVREVKQTTRHRRLFSQLPHWNSVDTLNLLDDIQPFLLSCSFDCYCHSSGMRMTQKIQNR
jgi:hypothetical protein